MRVVLCKGKTRKRQAWVGGIVCKNQEVCTGVSLAFGGSGERDQEDKWITRLVSADEPSPSLRKVLVSLGFPGFGLIVFVGWRD